MLFSARREPVSTLRAAPRAPEAAAASAVAAAVVFVVSSSECRTCGKQDAHTPKPAAGVHASVCMCSAGLGPCVARPEHMCTVGCAVRRALRLGRRGPWVSAVLDCGFACTSASRERAHVRARARAAMARRTLPTTQSLHTWRGIPSRGRVGASANWRPGVCACAKAFPHTRACPRMRRAHTRICVSRIPTHIYALCTPPHTHAR